MFNQRPSDFELVRLQLQVVSAARWEPFGLILFEEPTFSVTVANLATEEHLATLVLATGTDPHGLVPVGMNYPHRRYLQDRRGTSRLLYSVSDRALSSVPYQLRLTD